MRDLHLRKKRPAPQNRLKKTPKQRKPINFRNIFRKLGKLGAGGALLSALGFAGYELYQLAATTTFMKLAVVEVVNQKRLSREEIITLAGVKPGDAMLGLRLKRIGEQLVRNPWIATVKVRRYFPHTLTIELTEREPVAVVNMGYLYYLDKNGDVFKPLTAGDSLDFPVLTGLNEEDMGKDPARAKAALQEAVALIARLKGSAVFTLADISEIHYDRGYGFTLFTAGGGVPVKLGNGDFTEKLARLARIYKDIQGQLQMVDYIDLDFSDKIIVKKG
jgi:cell division protein FtsQ